MLIASAFFVIIAESLSLKISPYSPFIIELLIVSVTTTFFVAEA